MFRSTSNFVSLETPPSDSVTNRVEHQQQERVGTPQGGRLRCYSINFEPVVTTPTGGVCRWKDQQRAKRCRSKL